MALPVINIDDFKGWLKIVANSFKEEDLDEYIELFTEQYLRQIVGDAAFADIETQTRQKWTDLLNGVLFVNTEGKREYLPGLKKTLVRCIYFEYIRDNFTSTQTGKVKGKSANSERATDIEVMEVARSRYNQGARLVNTKLGEFLEANKIYEPTSTGFVDNADNTYTLDIDQTKYLEVGDFVDIGGQDFEVIALVANTSITIQASSIGLDFTGAKVIWEPFVDVDFCKMEYCGL